LPSYVPLVTACADGDMDVTARMATAHARRSFLSIE
jgi:hypothetical protein